MAGEVQFIRLNRLIIFYLVLSIFHEWAHTKYVSSKFDSLFFDPGFSCATGVSVYYLISNSKTISMLVSKIFQDN